MAKRIDVVRGQLEIIKSSVRMIDVIKHYGFNINNAGFANCPFHIEKTGSMKIYENRYKCFGCHASGDVIDFISKYIGTDIKGTIQIFSNEFGFDLGVDYNYIKKVINPMVEKRKKIAAKNSKIDAYEMKMIDQHRFHYQNKLKYMYLDFIHPLYELAIKCLPYIEYILDEYIPCLRKELKNR